MHRCKLTVLLKSPDASFICAALLPEAGVLPGGRSVASVECSDSSMRLMIKAEDTVAMRAAANSFLRWISAVEMSLDEIEGLTPRR
ncbi:MAG: KEOPS complex subunit Pcc1 [Thaumarchaeota archaeon]|nr:KEOPS complex subunit Pcc1 [Candidatus Calditenuaceae archaeon]MDW8187263.1 KEOPS complex subunit Pcc1 [Nitrososphaerota archaeon]